MNEDTILIHYSSSIMSTANHCCRWRYPSACPSDIPQDTILLG